MRRLRRVDEAVLGAVLAHVLEPVRKRAGAPEVLIIDDTGFPKQGALTTPTSRPSIIRRVSVFILSPSMPSTGLP